MLPACNSRYLHTCVLHLCCACACCACTIVAQHVLLLLRHLLHHQTIIHDEDGEALPTNAKGAELPLGVDMLSTVCFMHARELLFVCVCMCGALGHVCCAGMREARGVVYYQWCDVFDSLGPGAMPGLCVFCVLWREQVRGQASGRRASV